MKIILKEEENSAKEIDEFGTLKRSYKKINEILRNYMDMNERDYTIVSLWVIGTYFHKQFSSYPYLYFNAMKGSGKSRILKIIATLSNNGKVSGSMTEAVLFRTAGNRTLCIDEFENMNAKGNENLKLLLNSAYKKGLCVERVKDNKDRYVESFEVYCPIAMANIWGIENVLSDRCINIILETSTKKDITRLVDNFENEMEFTTTKGSLKNAVEKLTENKSNVFKVGFFDDIISEWNKYVKGLAYGNKYETLFKKIGNSNIEGRNLELFFPLFIIADMISSKILDEIIEI